MIADFEIGIQVALRNKTTKRVITVSKTEKVGTIGDMDDLKTDLYGRACQLASKFADLCSEDLGQWVKDNP